jgi:hypothetical protein
MSLKRGVCALVVWGAAALLWSGIGPTRAAATAFDQDRSVQSTELASESEARAVCSACHLFPPPDILPRSMWRDSVARMWLLQQGLSEPAGPAGTAGRMVNLPPEMQRVVGYYVANAPEQLPPPTPWPDADANAFVVKTYSPPGSPVAPAVSHVRALDLQGNGLRIVASDMRYGTILVGAPKDPTGGLEAVAGAPHPAHFAPTDLDRDGVNDLLIADLGQYLPADHTDGAIGWLRGTKGANYTGLTLDGWPRVADVEAGDFNGDGRLDLAVAAFGWRKVGRMSVLANNTVDYSRPSFVEHVIDPRPGGIHAVPVDINGDGRLDIIGLIAQQFETVVAYINTGRGFTFDPQVIYTAPHPNWGSSGIQVVDLDADGDLDVLYTHGDTFDDQIIKPYHGIMWLENKGQYPFEAHPLADLPGAFAAKAGDLDGDGDLDIVACSFIARGSNLDESNMPSLVWLEQVKRGVFVRHTLERRPPRHATLDVADVDGDGDLDILVGNFISESRHAPWVEVWLNRRTDGGTGVMKNEE